MLSYRLGTVNDFHWEKFELNRCSLSKVIERTYNFDNGRTDARTDRRTHGRTHARTGVKLYAPPPFFEWRGHNYYVATVLNLLRML